MEQTMNTKTRESNLPDSQGFFGQYGGSFLPEHLNPVLVEISEEYEKLRDDPDFQNEMHEIYKHYSGRPTPVFHAKNLSEKLGGAQIFLKREDLNHTGAHKLNHCLGEAMLAKKMGKKKLIAETGAGQHGVALATAAALFGLECDIYMGSVDIKKQAVNVSRMKVLGANVISASEGNGTLKEAVDLAFLKYMEDPETQFYAIGSVVGPHPFPAMVRDFQSIVGIEAKKQLFEMIGRLPSACIACVGGGSNAIGLFTAFLDEDIELFGVEPLGRGEKLGEHAATMTYGESSTLHGFKSYVILDENGNPAKVHSIASGLVYPSVGPQHSYLKDLGKVKYVTATDDQAIDAFFVLSRTEGIIPALESSHAVSYAMRIAPTLKKEDILLVNLSGNGNYTILYKISFIAQTTSCGEDGVCAGNVALRNI
jgi:tryptophan synthase beta chain